MPRIYKPDPRGKRYKKYDEDLIKEAVEEYRTNKNISLKAIAVKYNIDKSVLYRHSTRTLKKHGGQTILSEDTEEYMIKYINVCADWGYPLDSLDLRYLIKSYLDKLGKTVLKFKNNLPGPDFARSFLTRHKDKISQRNCQNIKKNRAEVSPNIIKEYFKEIEVSLAEIEPGNVINYDETNLTDDPGRKKIITKRGTKYPERVMNHSKASTSLMMAATAEGALLPPYVVYKAQNLYDTWTENGPPGTRYNRSLSGWFDAILFEDWVKTIVLPYFRGKEGKKCLIGDNLSSHLSLDLIRLCHEQNISFVFLPANSTHLTQPLDVAFFRPMKMAWRNIILKWKKTDGKTQASVPKGCFPRLLNKLIEDLSENAKDNILAGFRKTGIKPIDQNQVLSRLPEENNVEKNEDAVEKSVLDILKEMRYGTMNITEPKRKRKLDVIPGRSVATESEDYVETENENLQKTKKKRNTHKNSGLKCKINDNSEEINNGDNKEGKKVEKGKGKGKKTVRQDQQINEKENERGVGYEERPLKNLTRNEINDNSKEISYNIDIKEGRKIEKGKGKGERTVQYQQINEKENERGVECPMKNLTPNEINDNSKEISNNIDIKEGRKIEKGKEEGENTVRQDQQIKEKDNESGVDYEEHLMKNEIDNFNYTGEDLQKMPILFEDLLLYGDEIITESIINCEAGREDIHKNENLGMDINYEEKESKKTQVDKNKIKIIANEKFCNITMRSTVPLVTLNKCKNISAKTPIKIAEKRFVIDKPSTSGLKKNARRPSYYKSDADILKDLMDDTM